jgi:hypothetical protein
MTELTKEDVKDAVREALAEKIERTFGVDCNDVDERAETRKDMEFLRAMRVGARRGSERLFWGLVSLVGTAVVAWFWPDISKFTGK